MADPLGKRTCDEAIGVLVGAHRRLRKGLALARGMADGRIVRPERVQQIAVRVGHCFTRFLQLHVRDEEDSVAPRLTGREGEVDGALEAMANEHREHQRSLAVVVAACQEIARVPERLTRLAPYLRRALEAVEGAFERHFAREESTVFPAIRRLLGPSGAAQILDEMRARRRYGPVALGT